MIDEATRRALGECAARIERPDPDEERLRGEVIAAIAALPDQFAPLRELSKIIAESRGETRPLR